MNNILDIWYSSMLQKLNRVYTRGYKPDAEVRLDYDGWRINETQRLYDIFKQFVTFKDKLLVDIGCGKGQPAIYYALYTDVSHVVGIDMEPDCIEHALKLSEDKGVNDKMTFICNQDNKVIPLDSNSTGIILLQDMLEHAPDPFALLDECKRVLKPSGFLCVEFYPYYHRYGSHLTNYIKVPWHHIFFPSNILIDYVQQQPSNLFGVDDREWCIHVFKTLNRFSYRQFVSYLRRLNFKTIHIDIIREQFYGWKRLIPYLPLLRNSLCLKRTIAVFQKV